MRRGDVVIVSVAGDFGKPRPAVVVRSDRFVLGPNITVCLLTSTFQEESIVRATIAAEPGTGLKGESQIMIDKIVTLRASKVHRTIGKISALDLEELDAKLCFYLGLTKTAEG